MRFRQGAQREWRRGKKNRWTVYADWGEEKCAAATVKNEDGSSSLSASALGEPDGYVVADMFDSTGDETITFGPDERERAEAEADERNRRERQGPLPPEFATRRENLAKVPGVLFGLKYGDDDDPPAAPERYAVVRWSESWSEAFIDLTGSLDDALGTVESEGDGTDIWDLDSGKQLSVSLQATVSP